MDVRDYAEKFWQLVVLGEGPDDCWEWLGSHMPNGYGMFRIGSIEAQRKNMGAHKASVLIHGRLVPRGFVVHHKCFNRGCVNPSHLDVVTQSENVRMKAPGYVNPSSRKTHCPRGHQYDAANTRITGPGSRTADGSRSCRECGRAASKAWYHKSRQEVFA